MEKLAIPPTRKNWVKMLVFSYLEWIELGSVELHQRPLTAGEIARALGLNKKSLRILLWRWREWKYVQAWRQSDSGPLVYVWRATSKALNYLNRRRERYQYTELVNKYIDEAVRGKVFAWPLSPASKGYFAIISPYSMNDWHQIQDRQLLGTLSNNVTLFKDADSAVMAALSTLPRPTLAYINAALKAADNGIIFVAGNDKYREIPVDRSRVHGPEPFLYKYLEKKYYRDGDDG